MPSRRRSTVPVVLVAGFLGAGKTTLLNHLLTHNDGIRIGVVVNDFGAVNIDSMLVAGQVDSMISLGNGCLCCAVDAEDLDAMFDTLSGADLDVIVVESSGLAEPRAMVRLVLGSENPNVRFGGLVMVIDAVEFAATAREHPEIAAHVPLADLVVLNKSDRVDAAHLEATVTDLRSRGAEAPVVATAHGAVDPHLMFDAPERGEDARARQLSFDDLVRDDAHDHSTHLHAAFDSTVFASDRALDPRRLVAFLESPPHGLYRSKGFVDFGSRRYVVHTVGRHIRFEPARGRGTELVLIGSGLDGSAAREQLSATVTGTPAADEDLVVVHRYVA